MNLSLICNWYWEVHFSEWESFWNDESAEINKCFFWVAPFSALAKATNTRSWFGTCNTGPLPPISLIFPFLKNFPDSLLFCRRVEIWWESLLIAASCQVPALSLTKYALLVQCKTSLECSKWDITILELKIFVNPIAGNFGWGQSWSSEGCSSARLPGRVLPWTSIINCCTEEGKNVQNILFSWSTRNLQTIK